MYTNIFKYTYTLKKCIFYILLCSEIAIRAYFYCLSITKQYNVLLVVVWYTVLDY